jgi:hypothetical protein
VLKTKRPKPVSPKSFSPQKPPSQSPPSTLLLTGSISRRAISVQLHRHFSPQKPPSLDLSISSLNAPVDGLLSGRSSPRHRRPAPSSVVPCPHPPPSHSISHESSPFSLGIASQEEEEEEEEEKKKKKRN